MGGVKTVVGTSNLLTLVQSAVTLTSFAVANVVDDVMAVMADALRRTARVLEERRADLAWIDERYRLASRCSYCQ